MAAPRDDPAPDFHRRFEGRYLAVRETLAELRATLAPEACDAAAVEIVLAEVLNNIIEHGYGGDTGPVELRVWAEPGALSFEVIDCGAPLPGGRPPPGRIILHGETPQALPEGGFGWHLIRKLTAEIDYRSESGRNRLRCRIPAP